MRKGFQKVFLILILFVTGPALLLAYGHGHQRTRATVTPGLSNTPTMTGTPTMTQTPTHTPTGTITPATFTPTRTLTDTPTPTRTPTMTPTATSTPGIFQFKVSPKPGPDGNIQFQWNTSMAADEVEVKVFTYGFRLVREFSFDKNKVNQNLSAGDHELLWDGKDQEGRNMPSGVYLCFITVEADNKTYQESGETEIP